MRRGTPWYPTFFVGRADADEIPGPLMVGAGEGALLLYSPAQRVLLERFKVEEWRLDVEALRGEEGLLARIEDYMIIAWAGECTEAEF